MVIELVAALEFAALCATWWLFSEKHQCMWRKIEELEAQNETRHDIITELRAKMPERGPGGKFVKRSS